MWILEQCRKEWNTTLTYGQLIDMAPDSTPFKFLINPDDAIFANPQSMIKAIDEYCESTKQSKPASIGEYVRCIFDSLALRYKQVLNDLQTLAPFTISRLHIIGGGSQNRLLNQLTANSTGIPVVTGPTEATAIGNIMMQAKALNAVGSIAHIREIVSNSSHLETYLPQDTEIWTEAYKKFNETTNKR